MLLEANNTSCPWITGKDVVPISESQRIRRSIFAGHNAVDCHGLAMDEFRKQRFGQVIDGLIENGLFLQCYCDLLNRAFAFATNGQNTLVFHRPDKPRQ